MGTQFRDDLIALIEENRKTYTDMSDTIWGYAEPRFQEYKSSELQQEYMKSEEEMLDMFYKHPETLSNTKVQANSFRVTNV